MVVDRIKSNTICYVGLISDSAEGRHHSLSQIIWFEIFVCYFPTTLRYRATLLVLLVNNESCS